MMRVVIMALVVLAGSLRLATPVLAAPVVPHGVVAGVPAITMVRQRCGEGMKREKAWQDKNGAWHGKCVPKH